MDIFEEFPRQLPTNHYILKLIKPCLAINFMKIPVDGHPKNRKSILYNIQSPFHH